MDCRYQPARQLSQKFLLNCCRWSRQFLINYKMPCYQFFVEGVLFILSPHAQSLFNLQKPSLQKNNDSHNVIPRSLPTWFSFAYIFIMIPLQGRESIDCRMKTFWILWRVSQIFLSILFASLIPYALSSFIRTIINSWEMPHALKSYMQSKLLTFFKTRKKVWVIWEQEDFHQSQFILHNWPLSKRIFVMLILFIKEGILKPTREMMLSFMKCIK